MGIKYLKIKTSDLFYFLKKMLKVHEVVLKKHMKTVENKECCDVKSQHPSPFNC